MQLPAESSSYTVRVRFGRYLGRRLRRAGLDVLAMDAEKATAALKAAGRAWEDADEPAQDAMADRDAADDALDVVAQEARNNLAGRGVGADKQEPYTLLFPLGIGYYIAAPLDEEERRFGELVERAEAHLPANDAVREVIVSRVKEGLASFQAAAQQLEKARTASALAATELDRASERWRKQMEKTYGAIIAERGKQEAERMFPRTATARSRRAAVPVA